MSSKIYFNAGRRLSLRRMMTGMATTLHHRLAPRHAKRVARALLLTPQRDQRAIAAPVGLSEQPLTTPQGEIMTYRLGSGPVWLLVHGWSGSARQFFPLMEQIAAAGFTALAYDHPAHGQSAGRHGHLPLFLRTLETLLDHEVPPVALTAHSMGAAVVLSSHHPALAGVPLLLVAPVLDYVPQLYGMVARSGYSMPLFKAVVRDIEEEFQLPLANLDPLGQLLARTSPATIVHDREDRFAPYLDSARAAEQGEHVSLITTEGLGHGRILASAPLFSAIGHLRQTL